MYSWSFCFRESCIVGCGNAFGILTILWCVSCPRVLVKGNGMWYGNE
jgi:hypothetical protein